MTKLVLASLNCGYESINQIKNSNKHNELKLKTLFKKNEYIPLTHGIRDCIIDTDYKQIEKINHEIILKAKENKFFRKNTIDGLTVMAWDGVEINETNKNIEKLPEREHSDGKIKKYVKFVVGMNIGEKGNIVVAAQQLEEVEKITTATGKERAKTIGETKVFKNMWKIVQDLIGRVIDVHVFDALYLKEEVTNLINKAGQYFVIRLKDETRHIYQDAKGLFENRKADLEYEIVEIITTKNIKYSKEAKKKNKTKTTKRIVKRELTNNPIGVKITKSEYTETRKNSTIKIKEYERVVRKKETWSDEFDLTNYDGKVRVVRAKEKFIKEANKIVTQDIYVVTNMLFHDIETILKIMHYRWNIENCGFRTLKQRYNLEHIYIGDFNAINYMVQMIFLAFNLLELYLKIRLKNEVTLTWFEITELFKIGYRSDKNVRKIFENTG